MNAHLDAEGVGFPEPLVLPPLLPSQKQTIILLHGRGGHAREFAPALLWTSIPYPTPNATAESLGLPELSSSHAWNPRGNNAEAILHQLFPHAKLVFPNAMPTRVSLALGDYMSCQWFDTMRIADLAEERTLPRDVADLPKPGLRATTCFVHGLLDQEIDKLCEVRGEPRKEAARNILFGGLSQGCAAGLVASLLWEGEPLGGFVGWCGWLPLVKNIVQPASLPSSSAIWDITDNNAWEDATGGNVKKPTVEKETETTEDMDIDSNGYEVLDSRADWLREEMELAKGDGKAVFRDMPFFLSHGAMDPVVPLALGQEAKTCLEKMGARVEYTEHERLTHWYSGKMLAQTTEFIADKVGWKVGQQGNG